MQGAILTSRTATSRLSGELPWFRLAPNVLVHGVLMDIYGMGVLDSGSKERDRSWACETWTPSSNEDDHVDIYSKDEMTLWGEPCWNLEAFRDSWVGIIDIMRSLWCTRSAVRFPTSSASSLFGKYDTHKTSDRLKQCRKNSKFLV